MNIESNNYTILIVDDNNDFRSTLIEYFKGKSYNVFGAENGLKALKLIKKKPLRYCSFGPEHAHHGWNGNDGRDPGKSRRY